jgi:hypothetical protein
MFDNDVYGTFKPTIVIMSNFIREFLQMVDSISYVPLEVIIENGMNGLTTEI